MTTVSTSVPVEYTQAPWAVTGSSLCMIRLQSHVGHPIHDGTVPIANCAFQAFRAAGGGE